MRGKGAFRLCILLGSALLMGWNMPAQSETIGEELSALLWAKMSECWATVSDLSEPERLTVVIRVEFDRKGQLISDPVVVTPQEIADYDEDMKTARERALRAVKGCAPYSTLPIEHYEIWQTVTFRFKHEPEDRQLDTKG